MKIGVVLSSTAHVALLTWGLWSFSAPTPLMVADVEALPIDIVPIEEITQSVAGDKKAELSETPAPTPTKRPDTVPEAQNVGDAKNDTKSEKQAEPAEKPVEVARAETPPPAPIPTPKPRIIPEAEPVKEETPAPTNEVSAVNEPKVDVAEPAPIEDTPIEETGEQFASLSQVKAVPIKRPEPQQPQKAETTDRKKAEEPAKTTTASSTNKDDPIGDIAKALESKEKPTSSGSKKSTQTAALGTSKPSSSGKLSTSELDALTAQMASCWALPAGASGADELKASVEFDLDSEAKLVGRPRVTKSSGNRTFDSSAVRAIQKCNQQGFNLPKGKFDVWNEVQINFDPSQMF
ncbi:MAG: TonB C-terminal domain-containing protein [Salaquimonas sp.]